MLPHSRIAMLSGHYSTWVCRASGAKAAAAEVWDRAWRNRLQAGQLVGHGAAPNFCLRRLGRRRHWRAALSKQRITGIPEIRRRAVMSAEDRNVTERAK